MKTEFDMVTSINSNLIAYWLVLAVKNSLITNFFLFGCVVEIDVSYFICIMAGLLWSEVLI